LWSERSDWIFLEHHLHHWTFTEIVRLLLSRKKSCVLAVAVTVVPTSVAGFTITYAGLIVSDRGSTSGVGGIDIVDRVRTCRQEAVPALGAVVNS
jgi:hypothetical protein